MWQQGGFVLVLRPVTPSVHADRIYALANCDTANPPAPAELIRRLLGADAATRCYERPHASDARLFTRDGAWRALVPAFLEGPMLAMALARTLARWYVLTEMPEDVSTPDIDGIAAAIVLPDAAVLRAIEHLGRDVSAIASWLVLPHEVIAARLDDVAGPPKSGLYPSVRVKASAPQEPVR